MKPSTLRDLAELVGLAAIVASLVFVGVELRQAQRIAFAEQQGALVADRMSLNQTISENAELILKLNSGAIISDAEQIVAESLVDSAWGHAFFGYRRWYFLDHPAMKAPLRNFARFLYLNPGLRKIWEAERDSRQAHNNAMNSDYVEGGTEDTDRLLTDMLASLDEN